MKFIPSRPAPAPPDGLHYAKARGDTHYHIANAAGRRICDGGPSYARGVAVPRLIGQVHGVCIAALRSAVYRSLETRS